ncbi:MAG: four helix bundle protein [Saprospiraceae bacterium]
MKQEEFNELFRQRTKKLALAIITITTPLKYSDALGVIRKQLIRASTSVASNFRAVCRSRSDREKFSKLCIVVEEADEVPFWIEMLIEAELITMQAMSDIVQEADEILKVMSAYKKRLYDDLNKY